MVKTEATSVAERPLALGSVPLVDRDELLREFETFLSGLVPSHSGCLSIEGGWGLGRTSFLNAACLTAAHSGWHVVRVRGEGSRRNDAFGVLLRIIEGMNPFRDDDQVAAQLDHVLHLVRRDGERSVGSLGAAFLELLVAVRTHGPVMLAIDDADLVDDVTMRTLEYLYQRSDDQQISLVTTSPPRRPGTSPRAIDELLVRHSVRHFELAPLSGDGVRTVLSDLLHVEPESDFVRFVVEATGGRPEFVVELARACLVDGCVVDEYSLEDLAKLTLPRVALQVETRLDVLTTGAREILEVRAVGGSTSDVASVLALVDLTPDAGERSLEALRRAELLQSGPSLNFVAPVVRWAVLQHMTPSRRSQLHERWADRLALQGADEAVIANHLLATELAWNDETALKLQSAGRRLLEQGNAELASKCLRKLLDENAVGEPSSLWLDVAECEIQLGLRSSLTAFQQALALGAQGEKVIAVSVNLMDRLRGWPDVRAEGIATLQSLSRRLSTEAPESQLQFELALTLLAGHPAQRNYGVSRIEMFVTSADDESGIGRLARCFLDVLNCERDSSATDVEIAERFGSVFVDNRMPVGDVAGQVILMRACRLLLHSEQFAVADEFLEVARRRAYSAGDVTLEDDALHLMVLSKLWQGSLDEADEALRRHDELSGAFLPHPVVGSSDLFLAHDRTEEALRRFKSIDLDRIIDPLECALAHVERGRLFVAATRLDDGLDEFMRAKSVTERAGLNEVLVAWRPSMARALASLDIWQKATTLASEHLDAARTFGAPRSLGCALRAMADVTRDREERFTWLSESLKVLADTPSRLETAEVAIELGALLIERRDLESASVYLGQGVTLAVECKSERLVRLAEAQLGVLAYA